MCSQNLSCLIDKFQHSAVLQLEVFISAFVTAIGISPSHVVAGIGMPVGGFPSSVLDNYDFDAVAWNIDRIGHKEYPLSTISFVVEGAEDGFSVRQFAAVYSCRLDRLNATEPDRTSVH
ncbi:hypothetical protein DXM21_25320 [Agrobacterium rosae]|nr:hypothetical protein DXM21_25320 [Agrobacterium rosae]KAA3510676.1 hypothetical protein DXM25_25410 [Agrobacterium rosae]MQB51391.1 hypothetical protein [Agrobacterium rosae]